MDNQKPNIIFYCNDPKNTNFTKLESEGASGTISSMLWIAEGLSKSGYSVTILNESPVNSLHLERGVLFVDLEHTSTFQNFKRFCTPTVMVCVGVDLSHKALQIKKYINSKVWFWHHNPIKTDITLENLKEIDIEKHIFVSLNHAIRHLKMNPRSILNINKKFRVIYNPLDLELLSSQPIPSDHTTKKIKIAYIGNTSPEKGFDKFTELKIKTDSSLSQEFEWHAFGNGLYSRENLPPEKIDGIIPHGTLGRHALYRAMTDIDIVACGLSGNETFCVTAIEAAYLGKKIITTRKGGQIETLYKFRGKHYIENISKKEDILDIQKTPLPTHHKNKFRSFCREKYSKDSTTEEWKALLNAKAASFSFLPNALGTLLSLGIKK